MAEGGQGSRRLFKVWSADRRFRKAVMATTLAELIDVGCTKLGYSHQVHQSDVRVVLEADGTDVEDEATFGSLLRDTVVLLMLPGEVWLPPSVEAIKTAINAIPQIVCEAMQSLEIVDIAPSWKIMEHKGKVTVVLTWEPQDRRTRTPDVKIEVLPDGGVVLPGRGLASGQSGSRPSTASSGRNKSPQPAGLQGLQAALGLAGSVGGRDGDRDAALAALPGPGPPPAAPLAAPLAAPTVTPATTDPAARHERGADRREKKKHADKHNHAECDFHCSSLHQQQHKAAATSPIVDFPEMAFGPPGVFGHGGGGMPLPQSKSVHFEAAAAAAASNATAAVATDASGVTRTIPVVTATIAAPPDGEPESESVQDDDEGLADRYLLLVDQLSVDQDKHLTIKDIGVILERLSSKIVDVERLERERESNDIHNWTIKATLRGGHVLSEVGVVYNGRYYGVIEHPGYF